jgi:hypothetical protein
MSAFLDAMRAKWAEYGNVESPALQYVWNQMQATLDSQSGPDALDVWPATGLLLRLAGDRLI